MFSYTDSIFFKKTILIFVKIPETFDPETSF